MDKGLDLQTAYREGYEQGKLDAFMELTNGGNIKYQPVVRCKECVYWLDENDSGKGKCAIDESKKDCLHYCSWGVRREENE